VVNLLSYFCRPDSCPAVIGGALVYKDTNHITAVFMETVGPFLERAVRRLRI
jgi:hypothetical protein